LRRKASPFWIILLLVGARSEHPMIHPAAPDRSAIALANVRFRGQSGKYLLVLSLSAYDP